MFVKERMTPNPITVQETASISELTALMKENKLKKVPVLKGSKLVGVVTDKDIDRVSPSGATTLSVFEIGALLAKTTVKDAMKDAITVTPDTYIEDAAMAVAWAFKHVEEYGGNKEQLPDIAGQGQQHFQPPLVHWEQHMLMQNLQMIQAIILRELDLKLH